MTITIINTSQAPDARPMGMSTRLTTAWQTIITVPSYDIPEERFGSGRIVVPGVAEIISPLLACNLTTTTATMSIRIYRNSSSSYFMVANQIPIPANDTIVIPLNGQFIYTGDLLEVIASTIDSIDITLSYTVGQSEENDVI